MHLIDMFLLNKFQAISDWFQEWFGINNFTLARICLVCIVILSASYKIAFMIRDGEFSFFLVITFCFICFMLMLSNLTIKRMEQSCHENPAFGNTASVVLFQIRMLYLAMLFLHLLLFSSYSDPLKGEVYNFWFTVGDIASKLDTLFGFFMIYFVSCTPKPHKTSKVKKWWKSFVESVDSAISGVFSPAPELSTIPVVKSRKTKYNRFLKRDRLFFCL